MRTGAWRKLGRQCRRRSMLSANAPISQYNVLFVVTATRIAVRINIANDALTAGSLQIQKRVFGDY